MSGLAPGRRLRVDTTVVETNVHYPTDSSLLGDGVRVLIRTMKKVTAIAGAAGTALRDRSRSIKLRVLGIARAARSKAKASQDRLKRAYGHLVEGLPPRWSRAIRGDDTRYPRIHPPLPDACVATGLPSHPLLRPADQPNPCQEYCTHP